MFRKKKKLSWFLYRNKDQLFNLDVKPNVTSPQQQQSSSSSISSLSSTSNVSLTNPPNPTGSPYSVTSSINDDPTVESTRLKLAHRLAI